MALTYSQTMHDFKTCQECRAEALCLPEMNDNWNLHDQPQIFARPLFCVIPGPHALLPKEKTP
jgi:hypothetical protein